MTKRRSIVFLMLPLLALTVCVFQDSVYVHAVSEGDIVITEIMADPSAVSDTDGEWFEVYNPTETVINMKFWIIRDDDFNFHEIQGDLVVQPEDFAVLGTNDDNSTNGGVSCGYVYTNFVLGNFGDEVVLEFEGGLVDRVSYTTEMVTEGASMQLHPDAFHSHWNDLPENWCDSTDQLPGGDYGTPGQSNVDCGYLPTPPPSESVGGISLPVNKLELLAPYIGLTILLAVAVLTVVYAKKRKRNTEINS